MTTEHRVVLICGQKNQEGFNSEGTDITVTFDNATIFSGEIDIGVDSPSSNGLVLGAANVIFQNNANTSATDWTKYYSTYPISVTVNSGAVAMHAWDWNGAYGPNPDLSPEELAVFEQGEAAMQAAPEYIKLSVISKGGWGASRADLFWTGIYSPNQPTSVQTNVTINGTSYEFNPGHPDNHESLGRTIFAQAGDVIQWTQLIFTAPNPIG
jgi:hypothetical protein